MAAFLLLSRVDKQVRRQDVGRAVLQCLHGLHSIETALSIFHSIISNKLDDPLSSSAVIGAFDAHVGDCACHMRAQMLWDVIEHFRASGRLTDSIKGAVPVLKEIKVKAALLFHLITKKNGNIRPLGFGPLATTLEIFNHIGFTDFLTYVTTASRDNSGSSTLGGLDALESSSLCRSPDSPRELGQRGSQSDAHRYNIDPEYDTPGSQSSSSTTRTIGDLDSTHSSTPLHSSRNHRTLSVDAEWNPGDLPTVIRFLTFCRLVSISKVATLAPGDQTRIIARLDPQYAYARNEEELGALGLLDNLQLHNLIRPVDRVKRNTLANESEAMQVYLAQLTSDWVGKTSAKIGLSMPMQRLCAGSAMTSARQITCISAYLSIFPIRAVWVTKGVPIILVIQRFCSDGYHVIYLRVTANESGLRIQRNLESLGTNDWFNITPVTAEELISSAWTSAPHFILICVSINGPTGDFYNRLVDDNQASMGSNKPHEGHCHEQDKYMESLKVFNFSSILLHFFAQHEQFPFTLPDGQNGSDYISKLLASELGSEACTMFSKAGEEAFGLGTGRSARLFSFQHIYLEYPGVVARQVKDMMDHKDKPTLIGYRQV